MRSSIALGMTAFVAVMIMGLVLGGGEAHAQQPSSERKAAEEALRKGLAAQKTRKHREAIGYLSRAINIGALARKQMTYALYRRAISNRAQKQPAQAISDLNSALFFKGDLSSNDRADAIEQRVKAFRDAGLAPTPVATASPPSQWAASATPRQSAATAAKPRVISTAPPRVVEPVRVVQPRRTRGSLPAGQSILGTGSTRSVAAPVQQPARAAPSAFQTRVAAARPSTPPRRTVPTYAANKIDRGVGVQKARRTARQKPVVTNPWDVATKKSAPLPPRRYQAQLNRRVDQRAAPLPRPAVQPPVQRPARVASARGVTTSSVAAGTAGGFGAAAVKPNPSAVRPAVALPSYPDDPAPAASGAGGVGQFFAGIFGGGSQAQPAARAPKSTAQSPTVPGSSAPQTRATQITTSAVGSRTAGSTAAQTSSTRLTAAQATGASSTRPPVRAARPTTVAAVAPPRPVAPTPRRQARSAKGYEIVVAVLRSQERAQALAKQLEVQYASSFWDSKKTARVLSSGTHEEDMRYAVRYGTYGKRVDTASICDRFIADGLDCQVVPR